MQPGEPSRTALFVAYLRALGSLAPQVPGFADAVAERLLPAAWAARVERTRQRLARHPLGSPLPLGYGGLGRFLQLRTVMLDRALRSAQPFEQLAILGAGLDTRAWRLPELEGIRVFEVDHPDTQAWKRARCETLSAKAADVRFVPVDFRRDALEEGLCAAGLEPTRTTFWLWEGVIPYLDAPAVLRTFGAMARLSSPGSRAAVTYGGRTGGRVPGSFLLALIGEPPRSAFTPPEFAEAALSAGWVGTSDSGLAQWQQTLAPELSLRPDSPWLPWNERIWLGTLP